MKIFNVGGATAIIEHDGVRILCDPWLDEGIFHGSWHHWPPSKVGFNELGVYDYIYISHIHEDHCSAGTLKYLDKNAEIIVADRQPNFVLSFLQQYEFGFRKIHLVKPKNPYILTDTITVDMITGDPDYGVNSLIDSALILKWDGHVIYNANDCEPYPSGTDYILSTYGEIDFAMIPYATGSSYPACFTNLSHDEKNKEKQRLYQVGMDKFIGAVKNIKPKYILPFADQYVIVGSRHELNQYMPHPASPGDVEKHFDQLETDTKLVLLNSGQSFDLDNETKIPDEDFVNYTEDDRSAYAKKHSHSQYDHEAFNLKRSTPLERLLIKSRDNLWKAQGRLNLKPVYRFYIQIEDWDKIYVIPLDSNKIYINEGDYDPAPGYLSVTVNATLLLLMLTGHISWNIADAALFIDYHRDPNEYDAEVHALWNYLKL